MPAKNPRINVVLEDPLYKGVQFLALKDGVSLSTKVRDLIRQALDTQEDIDLARLAEAREASWEDESALSHQEVWS
jgi:transcriptional antiterminator Rof (Rho-off)